MKTLNEADLANFKKAFDLFDKDNSGSISKDVDIFLYIGNPLCIHWYENQTQWRINRKNHEWFWCQ